MKERKFLFDDFEVTLGKFANQADGAAWVQKGGTVVLSTVVSSPPREFPGFFPLMVDYREIFAAAGKIPGGYFKREGRFTDKEVLTGRFIDRTVRPLFPVDFFNQVQVMSTVYSVDKENMPHGLALFGTSVALTLSGVPFLGPVGFAEIARVDGSLVISPKFSQAVKSDVRIYVCGTEEGICMIEGSTSGMTESEFLDAVFMAHEKVREQVSWQREIAKELGVSQEVVKPEPEPMFDFGFWRERAGSFLSEDRLKPFFDEDKINRGEVYSQAEVDFLSSSSEKVSSDPGLSEVPESFLKYVFNVAWKDKIVNLSFKLNKRFDLRDFNEVRSIKCDPGLLPFNHGSAFFQRGRTQALVSVTLGGGGDGFKFEELMDENSEGNFLLHYNFPPFSVGEVRYLRAPGRREVGHGALAASAISKVLPNKEKFPYLMRIVADILESDGSSSMATVCGSTMALLDAGVPIKGMVSGVAMGLFLSDDGEWRVITDIGGSEDGFGLMDFKVAGTSDKILAVQMDIKFKGGLKRDLLKEVLEKSRDGRLNILGKMKKVMDAPRLQLSSLVPRVVTLQIPRSKIGAVIGTGGKVIRDIIDKTSATIDIEDSGLVKIFGLHGEGLERAVNWVKLLGGLIDKGSRHKGKIFRVADFGFLVELVPGVDGMVHISTIPQGEQKSVLRSKKVNDEVFVEVIDYDPDTRRIKLKLVE